MEETKTPEIPQLKIVSEKGSIAEHFFASKQNFNTAFACVNEGYAQILTVGKKVGMALLTADMVNSRLKILEDRLKEIEEPLN